ncbi:MAG: hypothetical protein GTN62_06980 [Gemmatimonadales bacterium]|nr:hypothetical protein [Gemmatimonadales bacterium]NIN11243.1 hypothetical protein [Gemmatimonadales bacterium]NIN49842.1 hypothetical protein [Gemmatimonadales bacterium]NIP07306.1 hypothetical protein [Gemmatimonadales bacterium]NIR03001.1 hypothetical protein [Gemmatimonadales bacterium]
MRTGLHAIAAAGALGLATLYGCKDSPIAEPPITSDGTAPPTPTGLTVGKATTSSLFIDWNPSKGATSYQLYRSTSATGTYSRVYSGSNSSYTNTGLSSGTTYYYKVRATNSAGSSSLSGYALGVTRPATPTGLTVGVAAVVGRRGPQRFDGYH